MTVTIKVGDCLTLLKDLPDESVDCVVTSPPYWGLRDYGVPGQIGMEPTLGEHLAALVEVFREVRRVLKKTGTVWLNYGDSYAASPNGRASAEIVGDDRTFRDKPFSTVGPIHPPNHEDPFRRDMGRRGGGLNPSGPILASSAADAKRATEGSKDHHESSNHGVRVVAGGVLKPKDLCMIANRLAIALQDDGWWVRSEIIWHKPNPMPESIKDRPACAHEKIWLLSKSQRYYYDADAVAEPISQGTIDRISQQTLATQGGSTRQPGKSNGPMKAVIKNRAAELDPSARPPGSRPHTGLTAAATRRSGNKERKYAEDVGRPDGSRQGRSVPWEGATRNLRNVWTIPTAAFSEAHFATFPPALVEPCIKAGTSERGNCPHCGSAWMRVSSRGAEQPEVAPSEIDRFGTGDAGVHRKIGGEYQKWLNANPVRTVGWKQACRCPEHEPVPAVVLDPFGGAGTVGLVAEGLMRDSILFELNPEYAEIARNRILLEHHGPTVQGMPEPEMRGLPLLDAIAGAK